MIGAFNGHFLLIIPRFLGDRWYVVVVYLHCFFLRKMARINEVIELLSAYGGGHVPSKEEIARVIALLFTLTEEEAEEVMMSADVPLFVKTYLHIISKGGRNSVDLLRQMHDVAFGNTPAVSVSVNLPDFLKGGVSGEMKEVNNNSGNEGQP